MRRAGRLRQLQPVPTQTWIHRGDQQGNRDSLERRRQRRNYLPKFVPMSSTASTRQAWVYTQGGGSSRNQYKAWCYTQGRRLRLALYSVAVTISSFAFAIALMHKDFAIGSAAPASWRSSEHSVCGPSPREMLEPGALEILSPPVAGLGRRCGQAWELLHMQLGCGDQWLH